VAAVACENLIERSSARRRVPQRPLRLRTPKGERPGTLIVYSQLAPSDCLTAANYNSDGAAPRTVSRLVLTGPPDQSFFSRGVGPCSSSTSGRRRLRPHHFLPLPLPVRLRTPPSRLSPGPVGARSRARRICRGCVIRRWRPTVRVEAEARCWNEIRGSWAANCLVVLDRPQPPAWMIVSFIRPSPRDKVQSLLYNGANPVAPAR